MNPQNRLSFFEALFINLNIMMGTGVFVNTVLLAQRVGSLGHFLYIAGTILIVPLIICMAQLSYMHPGGNFYSFGSMIHPFLGFLSTWGYFIGKLGTATLGIHVCNGFLRQIFPWMHYITHINQDIIIIITFMFLNSLNLKTGSKIQYGFIFMKSIPLFFVILSGLFLFNPHNISATYYVWDGASLSLPIALFCFLGFESACSLSQMIENPQKNAPRVILGSFCIVATLLILYQCVIFGCLGITLSAQQNYLGFFPLLSSLVSPTYHTIIAGICSIAVATSALGGAYGIMYANLWNLYTLAQKKHIFASKQLSNLNKHGIPFMCAFFEGIVCLFLLFLTQGSQIPLQYTSTLASITAYSISTIGLLTVQKTLIPFLSLTSCLILLILSIKGFIATSIIPLIFYGIILIIGTIMFIITQKTQKHSR